jgi:PAS domain S-box-containing protein
MKNSSKKKFAELRRRAQKFLAERQNGKPDLPPEDMRALVHELDTYQIELELQNEELRKTQEELEQSRQQFSDLYEFAPVGYFSFDGKGIIVAVNLTGSLQLGVEKKALLKRAFTSFMNQDDSDLFYLHLQKVFTTNSKQTCALTLFQENGKPFYAQLDTVPAFADPAKKPLCQTTVTDINDRRELEEALKVSETRYRRLFEEAREGILLFDAETGKITEVNPFLMEMLGYSQAELLGKKLWELDCFKDIKASKDAFHNLRKRGYLRYDDLPLETSKGRKIAVEFICTTFQANNKRVIKCNVRDTTNRKFLLEPALKSHGVPEKRQRERRKDSRMSSDQLQLEAQKHRKTQESLRIALEEIKELKERLVIENIFFRRQVNTKHHFADVIGQSDSLKYVLYRAEQVAPLDTTVLILGETGTGKELIAEAIHYLSPRRKFPLVTVNCAAIPENLLESELFGREKGAFTGADTRHTGRFEVADGSTLCLDEIGELPLSMQAKLLRVIQHGEFERLGSAKTIKVDVRVVATTNRNLDEEIDAGRFRKDLFYRLNVFPITVPPLRQRKEDIPLLVESFVNRYARKTGKQITSIPKETMRILQDYEWPGNIRELESIIERAVILCPGPGLQLMDNLDISPPSVSSAKGTMKEVERQHILQVLSDTGWRIEGKKGAAEILGLHPSTMRARMQKFGIVRPQQKKASD